MICAITETEDCRQASLPGGALNPVCAKARWCRDHWLIPAMMYEEDPHTLLVAAARGGYRDPAGYVVTIEQAWSRYFEAQRDLDIASRRLWLPRWHPESWRHRRDD